MTEVIWRSPGVELNVSAEAIGDAQAGLEVGVTHDRVSVRDEGLEPVAARVPDREEIQGADVLPVAREIAREA